MAAPLLSKRSRAFVDAVIAAYDGGDSYDTVARKFHRKTSTIQGIMRKYSPGSIRTSRREQIDVRIQPKRAEEVFDLAALGQVACGDCLSCGCPLVGKTKERRVCGLCRAARAA